MTHNSSQRDIIKLLPAGGEPEIGACDQSYRYLLARPTKGA